MALASHQLLYWSMEDYEHSRYTEEFVDAHYRTRSLGGPMGSGFIFDTNGIHRGVPGGRRSRTTIVLEYSSAVKNAVTAALKLPLPCPSGDQRLIPASEREAARRAAHAAADTASSPPAASHCLEFVPARRVQAVRSPLPHILITLIS